jgi:hypothetical protein
MIGYYIQHNGMESFPFLLKTLSCPLEQLVSYCMRWWEYYHTRVHVMKTKSKCNWFYKMWSLFIIVM